MIKVKLAFSRCVQLANHSSPKKYINCLISRQFEKHVHQIFSDHLHRRICKMNRRILVIFCLTIKLKASAFLFSKRWIVEQAKHFKDAEEKNQFIVNPSHTHTHTHNLHYNYRTEKGSFETLVKTGQYTLWNDLDFTWTFLSKIGFG